MNATQAGRVGERENGWVGGGGGGGEEQGGEGKKKGEREEAKRADGEINSLHGWMGKVGRRAAAMNSKGPWVDGRVMDRCTKRWWAR